MRRALVVHGGWDGHEPLASTTIFADWLATQDFEVVRSASLDSYADAALMGSIDLIVQCVTMSKISKEQWQGLNTAVSAGVGLAGWHGGLCDSFREHTEYQFMTGGQWVAHPGGIVDYRVDITAWDDPITAGITSFHMQSEQYYMHTDPGNRVLATTTFTGEHAPLVAGTVMPQVWKRRWGKGKVFYSALGHVAKDFNVPEARTIMQRGLLWAAR